MSYRVNDRSIDRIVVESLFGNRALLYSLCAMLVESLTVWEDTNLLMPQFVIANLAHHIISDYQVRLLELVPLGSRVHSFYLRESLRDLLVFLNGHLVIKHRLEEANHVIVTGLEDPVFRDHVNDRLGVEFVI